MISPCASLVKNYVMKSYGAWKFTSKSTILHIRTIWKLDLLHNLVVSTNGKIHPFYKPSILAVHNLLFQIATSILLARQKKHHTCLTDKIFLYLSMMVYIPSATFYGHRKELCPFSWSEALLSQHLQILLLLARILWK